ncbi:MAG: YncE family protein [Pseudomonadota bacterium]
MIRAAALALAACVCLGGCNYARQALDYGRGPFDGERAVAASEPVYDGLHESAWDSASADGAAASSGVLFVANKRGNSVSRIDLSSGRTTHEVAACENPHELALSPDGKHVALGCYGGTRVDIFASDTLTKRASIDLGENARPHGLIWHRDGDIFATTEGHRSIIRISEPFGAARLTEFSTGQEGSHMLAVDADTRWAWTTDLGSRTVTRIDLRGREEPLSVTVGEQPEGIALTPDGETLWVSVRGSDQAFALDPVTMEIRETLETGGFPLRLAVRPQGDVAITSNLTAGSLSVIDLAKADVVRTIRVSGREGAQRRFQVTILWSDDGSRIYVAETASNTVAEIDYASGTILRRLKTGEGGDGLAILRGRPRTMQTKMKDTQ